jgi:hypothetical protein
MYVAAPGTPLLEGGSSAAGHVYFAISDGKTQSSYGFSPIESGAASGPGKVSTADVEEYQRPFYKRTLEITQEQYEKLKDFGERPKENGFDTMYNGATNSCIDFTWGALNHAGLHRSNLFFQQDKQFEGALKPLSNVEAIRSIKAPFPHSELNGEVRNRMPERTILQRMFSQEQPHPVGGGDDPLFAQARDAMRRLEGGLGREYDATSDRMAASAACLAKASGLDRIDHVVLSQATAVSAQGANVFVVQGALDDPSHRRAHMTTAEAVGTPVDISLQRMQQMDLAASTQNQQRDLNEALMQQSPRSGPVMG